MVARPKSPDGRRVTLGVRFSEPEAAAVDVARGELSRSEWARGVVLAALNGGGRVQARPVRQRREVEPAVVSSVPLERAPAAAVTSEPKREKCSHPKARVLKGKCWACGETVSR